MLKHGELPSLTASLSAHNNNMEMLARRLIQPIFIHGLPWFQHLGVPKILRFEVTKRTIVMSVKINFDLLEYGSKPHHNSSSIVLTFHRSNLWGPTSFKVSIACWWTWLLVDLEKRHLLELNQQPSDSACDALPTELKCLSNSETVSECQGYNPFGSNSPITVVCVCDDSAISESWSECCDIASIRVQECWQVSAACIVPLIFVPYGFWIRCLLR